MLIFDKYNKEGNNVDIFGTHMATMAVKAFRVFFRSFTLHQCLYCQINQRFMF